MTNAGNAYNEGVISLLRESIHKLHCNSHIKLPLKRNRVQYQCLKYGFHWVTLCCLQFTKQLLPISLSVSFSHKQLN